MRGVESALAAREVMSCMVVGVCDYSGGRRRESQMVRPAAERKQMVDPVLGREQCEMARLPWGSGHRGQGGSYAVAAGDVAERVAAGVAGVGVLVEVVEVKASVARVKAGVARVRVLVAAVAGLVVVSVRVFAAEVADENCLLLHGVALLVGGGAGVYAVLVVEAFADRVSLNDSVAHDGGCGVGVGLIYSVLM